MHEIEGLTLTPRLRRSVHEAAKIARNRGHALLGTEHTLLGLLACTRTGVVARWCESVRKPKCHWRSLMGELTWSLVSSYTRARFVNVSNERLACLERACQ